MLSAAFLLTPFFVWAHPHMSFSSTQEFVWKNGFLDGCWLEWTFDSYFSADIIYAYDTNGDGKFSAEESEAVYNNAFINLKNYYFFTFIRCGKKRTNPQTVTGFSANQKDGRLVYRFYIDLSDYPSEEIYLAVYDYTYFCDVQYPDKQPVTFSCSGQNIQPHYKITENKSYPVYYNPTGAIDDTTVYYEWKPGLITYNPKEIHIYYDK